jgi:3-hydroxymyristoyl/3-hydroxydecanoyl-(acyl carrier protein) dehydratase
MRKCMLARVSAFPDAGFIALPRLTNAPARTSSWRLDEHSRCFEGHFEGRPILPGIAHLALVLSACAEEMGETRVLAGLRDLRFKHPLGPGDEVDVILADDRDLASVRFEIRSRGEAASTGVLLFAKRAASHA